MDIKIPSLLVHSVNVPVPECEKLKKEITEIREALIAKEKELHRIEDDAVKSFLMSMKDGENGCVYVNTYNSVAYVVATEGIWRLEETKEGEHARSEENT